MENLQEHIDRPTLASEQVSVPQLSRREFLWLMGGALALGTSTEAHEETLEKSTVTEEGKVWMERLQDIAMKSLRGETGGLIDATVFLQEESKEKLNRCTGTTVHVRDTTVSFHKLEKPEHGYHYAFSVKPEDDPEETWYLSESPYYTDQFPDGIPLEENPLALWLKKGNDVDKLTQGYAKTSEMLDLKKGTVVATALHVLQRAKEARESERKDISNIRSFDLPRDKPIGYIGLIDANPQGDVVTEAMVDDVKYGPELLAHCGYRMVTDGRSRFVPVSEQVIQVLRRSIQNLTQKNIEHFFIKLSGHGNENGVYFNIKFDDELTYFTVLTPKELFALFDAFPSCTFFVTTDACFGGGYAQAMKQYKDKNGAPEGRITLFLQTKGYGESQEGRLKGIPGRAGNPKAYSLYYSIFLTDALLKGGGKRTFGEAHLLADQASKLLIPSDPEVWRSGKEGGISTAKIQENLRLKGEINV